MHTLYVSSNISRLSVNFNIHGWFPSLQQVTDKKKMVESLLQSEMSPKYRV